MSTQVFQRTEMKYLIDSNQKNLFINIFGDHMKKDDFYISHVNSLYFDTPNRQLIRTSIERPAYKEKLRLRFYGDFDDIDESKMFMEIKKKYDRVVYKRRISYDEVDSDKQVAREIRYFKQLYGDLEPAFFVSYKRESYIGTEDSHLRITFDSDIRFSEWEGGEITKENIVRQKADSSFLLPKGKYIMEIKTHIGLPRWILEFLDEKKIYKTKFSKCGTGYKTISCHSSNQ